MSIKEAAVTVLREAGQPLTVDEIYERIVAKGLFEFRAQQPKSVLQRQLRKHSEGIDMKLSRDEKCFRVVDGKKFASLSK